MQPYKKLIEEINFLEQKQGWKYFPDRPVHLPMNKIANLLQQYSDLTTDKLRLKNAVMGEEIEKLKKHIGGKFLKDFEESFNKPTPTKTSKYSEAESEIENCSYSVNKYVKSGQDYLSVIPTKEALRILKSLPPQQEKSEGEKSNCCNAKEYINEDDFPCCSECHKISLPL